MDTLFSMAAFALASSISPGPVNIVSLSCAARHGWRAAMPHVAGANLGFTLLLVLIGLGLHQLLTGRPWLIPSIRGAGVLFLLYLALRLASDDGQLNDSHAPGRPTALSGAVMQWLNPKAWLACIAGMGAFVADGELAMVWVFALLYLVICGLSLASWAGAGAVLRPWLQKAHAVRWFNRCMAMTLAGCALYLLAV